MDQFNILTLIAKQWKIVLLLTLIIFVAGFAVYKSRPASVDAVITVKVIPNRVIPDSKQLILQSGITSDATYLDAMAAAWLTDPATVKQIFASAQVPIADSSLAGLSKVFRVAQSADISSFTAYYSAPTVEEVNRLALALKEKLNQNADTYNQEEKNGLKMALSSSDVISTSVSSSVPLTPIAGLAVGFIFSLVVASIVERAKT